MPWKRIGSHRYLYRSARIGGRVRSLYLGRGPLAEALEEMARAEREEARAAREAEAAARREAEAAAREIARLGPGGLGPAAGAHEAAGYRGRRGTWRRRRGRERTEGLAHARATGGGAGGPRPGPGPVGPGAAVHGLPHPGRDGGAPLREGQPDRGHDSLGD